MRNFLRAALAAVLVVLALTACGGSSDANQQYINAVNAAQANFSKSMNKTTGSITATTTALVDQAVLRSEAQDMHDLGDDLSDIKPPKQAADAHARYVAAVYKMANVMQSAASGNTSAFVSSFDAARNQEHEALRTINLSLKSS